MSDARAPLPFEPVLDEHWTEADLEVIHGFIGRTYWAAGIPRDTMRRAMAGSLNLLMRGPSGAVVGYARVVTDRATFAYLCDVFVLEEWQGRGLGDWLIARVVAHPALQGLRRFSLFTKDAHALYARHGFQPLAAPDRGMERLRPDVYRAAA
ncbi:GNAT family N-acetyltransferase [Roseateles chitinivorans]|uniref:GNAT family N-acetyltransferase n=1 Tax=Roseateles chitinivorans TaxID=2917965 RepID=A0A2G9C9G6_9BURK|nr:GNAT family N-acetyltransferase [Roseateles chitinivorans]PIM52179.1 GNAT family N-acetyltransferase [Roseateles chitinivorans]